MELLSQPAWLELGTGIGTGLSAPQRTSADGSGAKTPLPYSNRPILTNLQSRKNRCDPPAGRFDSYAAPFTKRLHIDDFRASMRLLDRQLTLRIGTGLGYRFHTDAEARRPQSENRSVSSALASAAEVAVRQRFAGTAGHCRGGGLDLGRGQAVLALLASPGIPRPSVGPSLAVLLDRRQLQQAGGSADSVG
jgi:hypothetical protein